MNVLPGAQSAWLIVHSQPQVDSFHVSLPPQLICVSTHEQVGSLNCQHEPWSAMHLASVSKTDSGFSTVPSISPSYSQVQSHVEAELFQSEYSPCAAWHCASVFGEEHSHTPVEPFTASTPEHEQEHVAADHVPPEPVQAVSLAASGHTQPQVDVSRTFGPVQVTVGVELHVQVPVSHELQVGGLPQVPGSGSLQLPLLLLVDEVELVDTPTFCMKPIAIEHAASSTVGLY